MRRPPTEQLAGGAMRVLVTPVEYAFSDAQVVEAVMKDRSIDERDDTE